MRILIYPVLRQLSTFTLSSFARFAVFAAKKGRSGVGNPYNGYSWKEREDKFKVMKDRIASGELAAAAGPCALCGDPEPTTEFEYHDEDYSAPYKWTEPAAYVLCHDCHIYRLHQRFARPTAWQAFLAHVRRGGYASDLKDPEIKSEVEACAKALKNGQTLELRSLRPYKPKPGKEWFARLSLDRECLSDTKARPRP